PLYAACRWCSPVGVVAGCAEVLAGFVQSSHKAQRHAFIYSYLCMSNRQVQAPISSVFFSYSAMIVRNTSLVSVPAVFLLTTVIVTDPIASPKPKVKKYPKQNTHILRWRRH
ncbi:unnamed protein product, partial [Ectocarpus sp. 4 AP-2014]